MTDYGTYYASIAKPFFAPEPWVFGLAWGIIYPLIAIAIVYMFYLYLKGAVPRIALVLFGVNMMANLLFTPLQLGYPEAIYATLDIIVVFGTLVPLAWIFWKRSMLLFLLVLPYLLWASFATVLQVTIYLMNVA